MTRLATVELHKDELGFSAGHFTIFSKTERENLHGHNYSISVAVGVLLKENGMSFDYRIYKQKVLDLCQKLDRRFLLPEKSAYLRIEDNGEFLIAHFNQEKIPFLKRDVVILPICNVTIEELSQWFLENLIADKSELARHDIHSMAVKVFNGPGQSGEARWNKN